MIFGGGKAVEREKKMKTKLILISAIFLLLPVILFSAESPDKNNNQPVFIDRDGSTLGKAVLIKQVGSYSESIGQKYKYLEENFGVEGKDYVIKKQNLRFVKDRVYDETIIELPSKEEKTLYFDITGPFNESQSHRSNWGYE